MTKYLPNLPTLTILTVMPNSKYLLKIVISAITISITAITSSPINHAIAAGKSANQLETIAGNKDTSPAQQPNKSLLATTAKQLNATLVQYSIISNESIVDSKPQTQESELYIWVVKPTGEVEFRKVDLKAWGKIEKNHFSAYLEENDVDIVLEVQVQKELKSNLVQREITHYRIYKNCIKY